LKTSRQQPTQQTSASSFFGGLTSTRTTGAAAGGKNLFGSYKTPQKPETSGFQNIYIRSIIKLIMYNAFL